MASSFSGRRAVCATKELASARISSRERQDKRRRNIGASSIVFGLSAQSEEFNKRRKEDPSTDYTDQFCVICGWFFSYGRVIHPPELVHAAVVEMSFDDLIAEQREHATTQEQRSRIPVPINTR